MVPEDTHAENLEGTIISLKSENQKLKQELEQLQSNGTGVDRTEYRTVRPAFVPWVTRLSQSMLLAAFVYSMIIMDTTA